MDAPQGQQQGGQGAQAVYGKGASLAEGDRVRRRGSRLGVESAGLVQEQLRQQPKKADDKVEVAHLNQGVVSLQRRSIESTSLLLPRVDTPPAMPGGLPRRSGTGGSACSSSVAGSCTELDSGRQSQGGTGAGLDPSQFSSLAVLDTLYNAPLLYPGVGGGSAVHKEAMDQAKFAWNPHARVCRGVIGHCINRLGLGRRRECLCNTALSQCCMLYARCLMLAACAGLLLQVTACNFPWGASTPWHIGDLCCHAARIS